MREAFRHELRQEDEREAPKSLSAMTFSSDQKISRRTVKEKACLSWLY
jgi:hypothetical protein